MGILDSLPDMNTPEGQGLMAAAFSLLQARKGPGERGIAGALGQAGQQFMNTRNQSQQLAQRQQMNDLSMQGQRLQLDQAQEARARQQAQAALQQKYMRPEGFDYQGYARELAATDPMGALDLKNRLNPKPNMQTVAPGASLVQVGQDGTVTPTYTAPVAAEKDPEQIRQLKIIYGDGTPEYRAALQRLGQKTTTHQPAANVNNTVSIAGPENKYNQIVGEGLGKAGLDTVEAAKAAPEVVRNARMVRGAIEAGAITGTGAEARLAVQKALETAGLVGPGKAANTQALMAGLGKITLASIKSSGLGAGQGFTNTDREFLQQASSGTIDSTPENLLRVAELSERVATSSYQKGEKVLERWRGDPALRAVAQDTQLDPIPEQAQSGPAMSSLPPAQAHKGRVIRDTTTGKLLTSNGMTWVEKK